jgi:hypothetical protein
VPEHGLAYECEKSLEKNDELCNPVANSIWIMSLNVVVLLFSKERKPYDVVRRSRKVRKVEECIP